MKIFISYSRRESEWVQNLHAKLNNFPEHDVWMDKNLVGGVDWWNTILDNIEQADIVLYIMSPTSIESNWCRLELEYVRALNTPILPLLLYDCDMPLEIRRIQRVNVRDYSEVDEVSDQLLLELIRVIHMLSNEIRDGKYPRQYAKRPTILASHDPKAADPYELFREAEAAYRAQEWHSAQQLFSRIAQMDTMLNKVAKQALTTVEREIAQIERLELFRRFVKLSQQIRELEATRDKVIDEYNRAAAEKPDEFKEALGHIIAISDTENNRLTELNLGRFNLDEIPDEVMLLWRLLGLQKVTVSKHTLKNAHNIDHVIKTLEVIIPEGTKPISKTKPINFDEITPEMSLLWLESLAKRQGVTDGLLTSADLPVPEIEPTDPRLRGLRDYIPFGWSEERWQRQLQKETAERSEPATP